MTKFWQKKTLLNYLLLPISFIWQLVTFLNLKKKGYKSNLTIICIGNINVGGAGKTPFTIYLANLLKKNNYKIAILTRGYKSKIKVPTYIYKNNEDFININNSIYFNNNYYEYSKMLGDEALLLLESAPVVISPNRKKGIKLLETMNFNIILMDDGFQNPSVKKDLSILLINGFNLLGNGLVIPAGPLREKLSSGLKRADVTIITGNNNKVLPIKNSLQANIVSGNFEKLKNKQLFAFAGIANPEKFYSTLQSLGLNIKQTKNFKDHVYYTKKDLDKLIELAKNQNLQLVTTSKDYVKIPKEYKKLIFNFTINMSLNKADEEFLLKKIQQTIKNKTI